MINLTDSYLLPVWDRVPLIPLLSAHNHGLMDVSRSSIGGWIWPMIRQCKGRADVDCTL